METLLLLLTGAAILLIAQGVGLLLIFLVGEDHREALSYWYGLTGWIVWLWLFPIQQWRLRRRTQWSVHLRSPYEDDE